MRTSQSCSRIFVKCHHSPPKYGSNPKFGTCQVCSKLPGSVLAPPLFEECVRCGAVSQFTVCEVVVTILSYFLLSLLLLCSRLAVVIRCHAVLIAPWRIKWLHLDWVLGRAATERVGPLLSVSLSCDQAARPFPPVPFHTGATETQEGRAQHLGFIIGCYKTWPE